MKGYFCSDKQYGGDYNEYDYSGTITCLNANRLQLTLFGITLIALINLNLL